MGRRLWSGKTRRQNGGIPKPLRGPVQARANPHRHGQRPQQEIPSKVKIVPSITEQYLTKCHVLSSDAELIKTNVHIFLRL